MTLAKAELFAGRIVEALAPYCEKIEIAGSIRRRCAAPGDVDIVALPKSAEARAGLIERCSCRCAPESLGAENLSFRAAGGVRLDIYLASAERAELFDRWPSNWGSLLVCRTGSREFNRRVAQLARERGLEWKPYVGVLDAKGGVVAAADEEQVLRAVGLPWIPPKRREA